MTEAFVYDAIRTPRGKGKKDGSLYEVKPVNLLAGLLTAMVLRAFAEPRAPATLVAAQTATTSMMPMPSASLSAPGGTPR